MKKSLFPIVLSGIILSGCKPEPTAEKETQTGQPVREELTQLDLDGDFLLFMDTAEVEERVISFVDLIAEIAKTQDSGGAEVDHIVGLVKQGLSESGLLSVDSFAMSTKPVENDLTRTITVLDYGEEDDEDMLWRVLASEPTELKGIQYAPADTVLLLDSTASLSELWSIIGEAVADYLTPEQQEAFQGQIAMAEMVIGTPLDELFGAVENELFIAVQLSETEEFVIPDMDLPPPIPEPSALIGLQTQSSMLSDLLLEKLAAAGLTLEETQANGFTLYTFNIPEEMPLSVAPTLVQTDDCLLIGSNLETVIAALESHEKENGLISTEEYKKLLADAPEKVSGVTFLSPRLSETFINVVEAVTVTNGEEEIIPLFPQLFGGLYHAQVGEYVVKTPSGIYSKSYGSTAPDGSTLMTLGFWATALNSMVIF
ncbi:MAG: DUF3352 domain-containing protein [Pontiellaceae bacterium]|nr:DUF3352 domain-containing protein [Pontiellaceae bacterium]